jgi:hypothetical protein
VSLVARLRAGSPAARNRCHHPDAVLPDDPDLPTTPGRGSTRTRDDHRPSIAAPGGVAWPGSTCCCRPSPAATPRQLTPQASIRPLVPAASVGLALATPPQTPDELLRDADLAMYQVKRDRKARASAAPAQH